MIETLVTLLAGAGIGGIISLLISILRKWLSRQRVKVSIEIGPGIKIDLSNPEKTAQELTPLSGKPQVFFAYSVEDYKFVERLANDLQERGIRVWAADEEIKPGENWQLKIEEGLKTSGYLLALISRSSVKSNLVQKLFQMALEREQKGKWPRFIPILIDEDDTELPHYLQGKILLDFHHNYEAGLENIIEIIKPPSRQYRKKESSDTWHWCRNCSSWPTSNCKLSYLRPTTGELCNECKSKEAAGYCN